MAFGIGQIILLVLLAVGVVVISFVLYPTIKNYMGQPGVQNGGMLLKTLLGSPKKHKKHKK